MEKLRLGQKNKLRATWRVDFGMYLEGGGYEGKILLPEKYVPDDLEVGDEIEVFLYLDNEERLIQKEIVFMRNAYLLSFITSEILYII